MPHIPFAALRPLALVAAAVVLGAPSSRAAAQSLDLTVNDAGLSIGDSRRVVGVRLNFRDRRMEEVIGLNATIWAPYDDAVGDAVRGIALELPVAGARTITGLAAGLVGVGAEGRMSGIGVASIGVGAGGDLAGVMLGGGGVGSGGEITGIALGGLGAGAGGSVRGILAGGLGAGVGGGVTGFTMAGLGVGVGGHARGILVGGLGAGVGGSTRGLAAGGLGPGIGGDATGLTLAGVGGTARGLTVAGLGVGASRPRGLTIAPAIGSGDASGRTLTGGYLRVGSSERLDGRLGGLGTGLVTDVRGTQRGLTTGIVNIAHQLDGVQIGVVNIARSNRPGLRVLPLFNGPFR